MSTVSSLLIVLASQGPAHDVGPVSSVGFRVVTAEQVPHGSWIEHWPYECVYEITESADGLVVCFDQWDGYVHPRVHLWLASDGASAAASYGDCMTLWQGDSLAGTTCVVTDGNEATLQFELYDGGFAWFGFGLRGQVELGAPGVELAKRWSPPATDVLRHEQIEYSSSNGLGHEHTTRGDYAASGMMDAFDRRQGLWIVRESGSSTPIHESMWRDGLPHGIYRQHERPWSRAVVGQFENGFEEGQHVTWHTDGKRHVTEYRHGSWQWSEGYDATGRSLGRSSLRALTAADNAHWETVSAFHTRR